MKRITLIILLFILILGLLSCAPKVSREELPERPNVIFIITDDMAVSDLAYMPKTTALLEENGAYFEQFFVNISLCCPSRTSFLRGQYGHNTGIYDIEPPNGGFEKAYALGLEESMLPVWLNDVGYNTALFGKYMATYPTTAAPDYIPPGWVEWYSPVLGYPYDGYDYSLNENGEIIEYGFEEEDYITDVLSDRAVDYISRVIEQNEPFFAYVSTYAPHKPSTPAPRHAGMFAELELPRPPSFDEKDMGDKSKSMLWRKPLTEEDILYLQEHYRLRIESLQAVDEMVERIFLVLDKTGQLDNTYVFFTSDNGIEMGEHRLVEKKNWPYTESMQIPLLVMGPGIRPGLRIDQLSGNIDIAPTIADLTGASAADFVDGRSLLPLLLGENPREWRDAYFIQRGITLTEVTEISDWYGLRTERYLYLEFDEGDVQIYDLKKDPYEMESFSRTANPKLLDEFHLWLENLRDCVADECRNFDRDPDKWE